MGDQVFSTIDASLHQAGAHAALDRLVAHFLETRQYGRLFEARLMRKRHELGLPLMPTAPLHLDATSQQAYDAEMLDAARQAARLLLDEGRIAESWPFFRALNEPAPVRDAIERLDDGAGGEAVIEIALGERVHPRKGFAMLLAQHGICRAITLFDQYPDAATREDSLALLAGALYGELRANLRAVIERAEGAAPAADSVRDLMAGRDWLFGEYSYHADISHVMSVVRLAAESARAETVRIGRELAEYGVRLSPELQHGGEPPFEEYFEGYARYLRARMGEQVDDTIAWFRGRVASYDYEQIGTYPAQTLVRMLLRLGRPQTAIEVFEEFVGETDANYLSCPPLAELCQLAGDWERLSALAVQGEDLIRYTAAQISASRAPDGAGK
jgi:hypothetical protein